MSSPAHKIRIGVLQVTIWRNISEKGTWYSVTPSRSYKQGDETWRKRTASASTTSWRWPSCSPGPHLDRQADAGRRHRPQGPQGCRQRRRVKPPGGQRCPPDPLNQPLWSN